MEPMFLIYKFWLMETYAASSQFGVGPQGAAITATEGDFAISSTIRL